jgi:2-iminobutanoate/2-iminopropanoate deaminase
MVYRVHSIDSPWRSTVTRQVVSTDQAPAAIGPYSQAIRIGDTLYCSGQIALDPASGQLVGEDARAQATQVMKNLRQVIEAAGFTLQDVVKTTIFLVSMDDFATVNEVYGASVPENPPARSTVAAAALPRGALVEVDAIASRLPLQVGYPELAER